MKMYKVFAALVMGVACVACNNAAPAEQAAEDGEAVPAVKKAADYKPSKAQKDSVAYLLGINFGNFMKNYDFGNDLDYNTIIKGMKDFVNAKGNMRDADFTKQFRIDPNEINNVFNTYLEQRHNYTSLLNKEKESKFLEANGKKADVTTTESGLQYTIIEAGNEVKPSATDTVWVRYKGTLTDGTVFDEVAEDAEPVSFTLGQVVKGWGEGLQLIGEGGKIKLYIPSELGYGERGSGPIPACSTLIFDVELTKVGKVAAAEAAE
jgi:FKBP-type peptidyl-prolyl cis-trans isomerase